MNGLLADKRPLVGVMLMLGAMAVLPGMDVIAKTLGQQGMPILQLVWAQLALGAIMVAPFALRAGGIAVLRPVRPLYPVLRAILLMIATFCFFQSLKYLPIADALAIFFVQPLIVTILSALVLQEKVGPRRWIAVAVGFIGTLIIIRPGLVEMNPGSFLALAAGAFMAGYFILTRFIAGQAQPIITTFQTSMIGGLLLGPLMPLVWQPPDLQQWVLLLLLAAVANAGHLLIVKAYDHAEASLLAPLAYTEMVVSTLLGLIFFGDFPDGWTFLGVGILMASALYISMRERVREAMMKSVIVQQP